MTLFTEFYSNFDRSKLHIISQLISFPTLFTGQNLIELDKIPSTNTYASELLLKEQPPEGTVVLAYDQPQGRGQSGNVWESETQKNLTFSIIYYPNFLAADEQFLLNQIICIGICEYLNYKTERGTVIKWPNDILIKGQKISGILIENVLQGNKINSSVIGIGLNVNQTSFSKAAGNPTSLKLITDHEYDLLNCLQSLCSFIEAYYFELQSFHKHPKLREKYLKMLQGYHKEINYTEAGREKSGTIVGVSSDGKLEIKDNREIITSYNHKEIIFL